MPITQLIIQTPLNPAYDGVTYGVKFAEGQAVLTDRSKPNRFGHSLEELARLFRQYPASPSVGLAHYDVQALDESGHPVDVRQAEDDTPASVEPVSESTPAPKRKTARARKASAP